MNIKNIYIVILKLDYNKIIINLTNTLLSRNLIKYLKFSEIAEKKTS